MKKTAQLVIGLFMLAFAFAAIAQSYKTRQPTADEMRRVSGVDWYLRDGLRRNVLIVPAYSNNIPYTLNVTNDLVLVRSGGATSLTHFITLPNPTNNRQCFKIIAAGHANFRLFSYGTNNGFNDVTNALAPALTYTSNTNCVFEVFSTGTNWFVYPTEH